MNKKLQACTVSILLGASLIAGCGGSSASSNSSQSTASASETSSAASSVTNTSSLSEGSETIATSTSSTSTEEEYTTDNEYSVDVIIKTTASEYWQYVVAGAESYEKAYPNVKVDVKGASSETAYDEQQNMIETDLNSGAYDGYIIAPLQADLVATLINGKTMPIIAIDTQIDAPEIRTFVGLDQETAAKQGGEYAVQMAKDAGWTDIKAICISGVQGDGTCMARLQGYQEGIESQGGDFLEDETQYANAVADQAVTCMEGIIQTHPEGVAIICANNDDEALAAARTAAKNEAYQNTIFVGFDATKSACEAMLADDGSIPEGYMSVGYSSYTMGRKAVETMVKILDGQEVDDFVPVESSIVTKDNAQERLDELKSYV